ncbi:MAG: hypothetical protein DME23_00560 [Verrucomicrobia bacterium]|nr:MAG: hypothetical protein DME23_00560 [Verrucomicrobiota bacterium]
MKTMKIHSTGTTLAKECREGHTRLDWLKPLARLSALVCVVVVPLAGCRTETRLYDTELVPYRSAKLREGDVLSISFPGSPNLNVTAQPIRRDGTISLPLVNEVAAAGKTPAELEKELLKLYEKELSSKQISVTVQSSAYPVFVTGSVVRPGKIQVDRPITDLEAIMEAGGFDPVKANMRSVVVLRYEDGQLKHYIRNLKRVLEGKSSLLLPLRPSDIVYVPEKTF